MGPKPRAIVCVTLLLMSCNTDPKPVVLERLPPSTLDADAMAMARALRTFYVLAREGGDAQTDGWACEKAAKTQNTPKDRSDSQKACVADYQRKIDALREQLPPVGGREGCALNVADGVRAILFQAANEHPARVDTAVGIDYSALHETYEDCTAKLFRIGRSLPGTPPKSYELEEQLGMREGDADDHFSPADFNKPQEGHLWTAEGHEINRKTVELEP